MANKTLSRPQFEALRKAAPVEEWQDLPEDHALYCLRDRKAVTAQANTIKVLVSLGLVELAEGAISEKTGEPWNSIWALTRAGELIAITMEYGGDLTSLSYIDFVVTQTTEETPEDAIVTEPQLKPAVEYIEQWAAKVPSGTEMLLSKMKCALADGPCGCGEETPVFKCTGPYPPCPMEDLIEMLFSGVVEGVVGVEHLSPEAITVDHVVYQVEHVGPGKAKYIKKL